MQAENIYREWAKGLKEDEKEFGTWQADSIENQGHLDYHYHQFIVDLEQTLLENNVNQKTIYKYINRAERLLVNTINRLADKHDIPTDEEQPLYRKSEGIVSGTIGGYPVLTDENRGIVENKGHVRKIIFTSLSELLGYVVKVPYVLAIEEEFDSAGDVIGWRIWVEN